MQTHKYVKNYFHQPEIKFVCCNQLNYEKYVNGDCTDLATVEGPYIS